MNINTIKAKKILQNTADKNNKWFGFDYNMNLYQGCHHGCIYCDSRSECYHINNFDQIKIKENAINILASQLANKHKKGVICMGAMSDPYNQLEPTLKLTHQALNLINQSKFGVMITTKSNNILNDLDIIANINKYQSVVVCITITCFNDSLSKIIEPNVSLSSKRFEAIKILRNKGIYTGVMMTPILPFINDTDENIKNIVYQAHLANANFIYPLFGVTLRDNQREYFYQQLDKHFPNIKEKYQQYYKDQYLCISPRIKELKKLFINECNRYNITYDMNQIIKEYKQVISYKQLSLFK